MSGLQYTVPLSASDLALLPREYTDFEQMSVQQGLLLKAKRGEMTVFIKVVEAQPGSTLMNCELSPR
jgi:hypothetical protein